MSYQIQVAENTVGGKKKYHTASGHTDAAVFVQKVAAAPNTALWKRGIKVLDAKPGEIPRGTAIATFEDGGHYPNDGLGKHAAIYLSHDANGIVVLDQWDAQGEVRQRTIRVHTRHHGRVNDAEFFYVIE